MDRNVRGQIEEFIWNHIPKEERKYDTTETNEDYNPWMNAYIEFCNNTLEE